LGDLGAVDAEVSGHELEETFVAERHSGPSSRLRVRLAKHIVATVTNGVAIVQHSLDTVAPGTQFTTGLTGRANVRAEPYTYSYTYSGTRLAQDEAVSRSRA